MPSDLREQLQATLGTAYTLERELAGGGMSRVFVAADNALGRKVVAKVLPHDRVAHVSIERFKREIQLIASLQHPLIVPLLFAGESRPERSEGAGLPFYVMPFVSGESLRERLSRQPDLPVRDAMHVLRDVAAALAYAHGAGVVHRDIKPENIILSGGVAVVTDFGVAKAVDVAATDPGTGPGGLTSVGIALGTPAYMSPEQASADPQVDHRADIYSFGCVGYEMLCGASPFAGKSPQQMLAAHVTEAPPALAARRPDASPALAALVMQCLEKRAADRPQSAEELLAALDAISTPSGGSMPTTARLSAILGRRKWATVVAGAAIVAGGTGFLLWLRARQPEQYAAGTTTPVTASPDLEVDPAISPDGKFVAYATGALGKMRILVRRLDGGAAVAVSAALDGDHRWPRWSPDGSQIVFTANQGAFLVSPMGGTPRLVIEPATQAIATPSWSPDGKSLAYSDGTGIWIRPVDGGAPRSLVSRGGDVTDVHSPALSPDGTTLAFVTGNSSYVTQFNIATSTIWTVSVTGGKATQITDNMHLNQSPVFARDGHSLLYVSDAGGERELYQQNLSRRGESAGAPRRLTTGLGVSTFSLSADGTRAAYGVLHIRSAIWMAAIPATGAATIAAARQLTRDVQAIEGLDVSRDGKWLVFDSNRSGNQDIYKVPVDGGEAIQLTRDPAPDFVPQFSPDAREIAYYSIREGTRHVRVMTSDGRDDRAATSGPGGELYPSLSPDGALAYTEGRPGFPSRIVVASRDASGRWSRTRVISDDSVRAGYPRWSPDGKLIAYLSDGLRIVEPAGGPSRLLVRGGPEYTRVVYAAWGQDSRVVYYHARPKGTSRTSQASGESSFWSVAVSGGPARMLLRLDDPARQTRRQEFATDGHRLFFTLAADESHVRLMELKR